VRWNLNVVFICTSFMARYVEHFFTCFLVIWTYSFEKLPLISFAHFFIESLNFWEFIFLSSLYILVIIPLSDVQLAKIFSHSVGCLFNLGDISFVVQKLYNFMWSHLSILSLSCRAIWVLFRKLLPMPITSSVFPALPYTSLKVSGLLLRFLIHFELILVLDEIHSSSSSFLHADTQFSQQHLLKRLAIFSSPYVSGAFVKNQVGVTVWILTWVFILFHWSSHMFCASNFFLLLLFCSIGWNWVLQYLQHCFFCSVWPWLLMIFCASKWTLGLIFQSLWQMSLEFNGNFIKYADCFW
jgi:hypothetical protein